MEVVSRPLPGCAAVAVVGPHSSSPGGAFVVDPDELVAVPGAPCRRGAAAFGLTSDDVPAE